MSTEVETHVKVDDLVRGGKRKSGGLKRSIHQIPPKKCKTEDTPRYFRCCRKKSHSLGGNGKFFLPHKKRKKVIPPTKFLLGGNIHDPLNLNSLQDEEINRAMNAVTPESSPIPTPQHRKGEVEVIIPANIHDPLNLADCQEDSDSINTTPVKKLKKKHKRKRQRSFREDLGESKSDESKTDEAGMDLDLNTSDPLTGDEGQKDDSVSEEQKSVEGDQKKEVTKPSSLDIATPTICGGEHKKPKRNSEDGSQVVGQSSAVGVGGGFGSSVVGGHKSESRNSQSNGPSGSACAASGSSNIGGSNSTFRISKDKIVSPVIPQPGAWHHAPHTHSRFRKQFDRPIVKQRTPNFNKSNNKFQYGNYNRYYGYRNPNHEPDPRLKLLTTKKKIFEGKDVLDIGCNSGDMTLAVARELGARTIIGIDLDRGLIDSARAKLRHLTKTNGFPISMQTLYGTLVAPGIPLTHTFPNNVSFIQGNYVLQSDVLLELEKPQFDVILCLSVTKWVQLNWGDEGLKRAFKRMYSQLRPGGCLILEAQPYSSYKKRKSLTEEMWRNYKAIQLYPTMFNDYLLNEVGFSKCENLGHPMHSSIGFQRTIKIYVKSPSGTASDEGQSQMSARESPSETSDTIENENKNPTSSDDVKR